MKLSIKLGEEKLIKLVGFGQGDIKINAPIGIKDCIALNDNGSLKVNLKGS